MGITFLKVTFSNRALRVCQYAICIESRKTQTDLFADKDKFNLRRIRNTIFPYLTQNPSLESGNIVDARVKFQTIRGAIKQELKSIF